MKSRLRKRAVSIVGNKIHDHKKFGMLAFRKFCAIERRRAIKIALRLGAPKFYEYIAAFRLRPADGHRTARRSRGMLGKFGKLGRGFPSARFHGAGSGRTSDSTRHRSFRIANGGFCASLTCFRSSQGDQVLLSGDISPDRKCHPAEQRATLRRMMEGVILDGTGRFARPRWLDRAENRHRAKNRSEHGTFADAIHCVFTGFAPINNLR